MSDRRRVAVRGSIAPGTVAALETVRPTHASVWLRDAQR